MRNLTGEGVAGTMRARWRRLTGADGPPTDESDIESEAERAIRMFGAPAQNPFPEPVRYQVQQPDRRAERERARAPFTVFLPGLIIGGVLGYALTVDDPKTVKALPDRAYNILHGSPYYLNCAQVRLFGAAPLYKGQPGYSKRLDTDGNGVACEPFFGDAPPAPKGLGRGKRER
ncbi:MAG: hypothetical protein DCF31_16715 [Alphaproteobacteria bacterium]|nr:MAG: hypothetical protein DCF31_16715 [Alphaproteobacteria bacterium]